MNSGERDREEVLKEIFDYYKNREDSASQDHIVTMLREIQEVYGCIPDDIQQRAATAAGVKPSVIICIMKMYKSLKPAPYRHRITVCTGPRCAGKKEELLEAVRRRLSIGENGFSADGTVFLETRACLKQCRTAPNLIIDGILCPDVKKEELEALFLRMLG